MGRITNSDLEMAGLLLLWLVMEEVCGSMEKKRVALFSDNDPTVSWVKQMASRQSRVAAQLLRALALRLHKHHACPLTPIHIPGKQNTMTDIPSRSFGSVPEWHCRTNHDLLTLFNRTFPLPGQGYWTVFQLNSALAMKVTSVLRMRHTTLEEWRRLPKIGAHIGKIGPPMSNLWGWTLTYRGSHSYIECESSQASRQECDKAATVEDAASRLAQSLALSRPLARRSRWPVRETQQKCTMGGARRIHRPRRCFRWRRMCRNSWHRWGGQWRQLNVIELWGTWRSSLFITFSGLANIQSRDVGMR